MPLVNEIHRILGVWFGALKTTLTDPNALFWWPTLVTAVVGVLIVTAPTLVRRSPPSQATDSITVSLRAYLRELPVDIACYLGHTLTLAGMGKALFSVTAGGATLVFLLAGLPSRVAENPAWLEQLAVALMVFVLSDFGLYWSHRLFHATRWTWALHALHHNPPVLTPITAFRFWPPESAVHFMAFNLGQGLALGIGNLLFGARISPVTWLGVNVFSLFWYLAFSHLRHSPVPMAFPRWLSYVLVSPLMHQAHHSVDPRHHHRNFGTALAVWDWMFRSLYVPRSDERFQFGIAPSLPMETSQATLLRRT